MIGSSEVFGNYEQGATQGRYTVEIHRVLHTREVCTSRGKVINICAEMYLTEAGKLRGRTVT